MLHFFNPSVLLCRAEPPSRRSTHLLPLVDAEDAVGVVAVLADAVQLDGVAPALAQVLVCNTAHTSLPVRALNPAPCCSNSTLGHFQCKTQVLGLSCRKQAMKSYRVYLKHLLNKSLRVSFNSISSEPTEQCFHSMYRKYQNQRKIPSGRAFWRSPAAKQSRATSSEHKTPRQVLQAFRSSPLEVSQTKASCPSHYLCVISVSVKTTGSTALHV